MKHEERKRELAENSGVDEDAYEEFKYFQTDHEMAILEAKVIAAVRAWRELGDDAPDIEGIQKTLAIFSAMDALDAHAAKNECG
jgi:hypothetical protein